MVVSPTPTHPQDHGNRKRIFELCSELKRQGARIHFVHYASEHDWRHARPLQHEQEMIATWDSYQLVPPSRPLHEGAINGDHQIDEWADPALSAYIRWAFHVRTYDVVLVEYTWMSFCFQSVPEKVFKVCDTHDVFGGRRALLEKNGIGPEFFYTTPEQEKIGLSRADLVWAIKDLEREYFERDLGLADCLTLLYSEPDRHWWRPKASSDGWLRAGVIGARNSVNRRNLEAFLHVAMPLFERYMAPVKIVIAGGCSEDFKGYRHRNIEVLGRVPDVADFYRDMDVICAPMQFSTGLKIKVAEALSSGAPLVAHAHATEGYPVEDPRHLLPDFTAMARELVKLSFNRAELPALAQKSRIISHRNQQLVLDTIDQTRQRLVKRGANHIVVVTHLEALNPLSLLHDHLYATINYLRFARQIVLYIVGKPARFSTDILHSFGYPSRVFIEPGLADAIADRMPDGWTPLDLQDLLETRGISSAYFLAADERLAELPAGTLENAYVRTDAIELSGDDPLQLVRGLRSKSSVVVISSLGHRIAIEGIRATCQAPFRRKNRFSSIAARAEASGYWGGLLVLSDAKDPLVKALTDLGTSLSIPVDLIDVYDAAAVQEVSCPHAGSLPRANVAGARLVVDLGTESAVSAVVLEGAERAGIPVIRFVRGRLAAGRQQLHDARRPSTVGALLRAVALGLVDPAVRQRLTDLARQEAVNLSRNDAGWSWLWRDLNRKDSREGVQNAAERLFG